MRERAKREAQSVASVCMRVWVSVPVRVSVGGQNNNKPKNANGHGM